MSRETDLLARASTAYTAGSQRQVIYLAGWLLSAFRTEDELCEQLHYVIDEIYPPRRLKMLEKALAKLKTPGAKKFMMFAKAFSKRGAPDAEPIAGCKKPERKRACRIK